MSYGRLFTLKESGIFDFGRCASNRLSAMLNTSSTRVTVTDGDLASNAGVTAIALGDTIEVELTCREERWIDRFAFGSFEVAALGPIMLDERELPHDNLPRLFPVGRGERP